MSCLICQKKFINRPTILNIMGVEFHNYIVMFAIKSDFDIIHV